MRITESTRKLYHHVNCLPCCFLLRPQVEIFRFLVESRKSNLGLMILLLRCGNCAYCFASWVWMCFAYFGFEFGSTVIRLHSGQPYSWSFWEFSILSSFVTSTCSSTTSFANIIYSKVNVNSPRFLLFDHLNSTFTYSILAYKITSILRLG
jgi:hypothetical protein